MTDHDRLGPPRVEPLSDVAWARVERGLWERLDGSALPSRPPPRGTRWVWLAVPLAAAAALALVIGLRGESRPAEVDGPTIVDTGPAPSSITVGDAHIVAEAHSRVVISRDAEAPTAMLEYGAARFAIAHRGELPPFMVVAGDTVVRVIGTEFRVARSAELVEVEVERGTVEIRHRGTGAAVAGGQRWSSQQPRTVSMRTRAALAEPAAPAVVTPAADEQAVPAPPPPPTPRRTHAPAAGTAIAPAIDTPPAPASRASSDREAYERLAALERRDPAAALEGYLELSQRSGAWAAVSLFAAGRLAADLKDRRARTFLDIYLKRFPNGANADDARKLLQGAP